MANTHITASVKLGFERQGIGKMELWNAEQPARKVVKSISEVQQILRRCHAVDEIAIEMLGAMELNTHGITVENAPRVLKELGLE